MKDAFKASEWLGIAVFGISVLTVLGWIFNISPLTSSILPGTISVKFITALLLTLVGVILTVIGAAHRRQIDVTPIVVFGCGFIILLLTGTLLYTTIAGGHDGVSTLFVTEGPGAAQTLFPGRPPVATMIVLVLVCIVAGIGTVWSEKAHPTIKAIGVLVTAAGAIPIIGYIVGVEAMYYGGIAWTNPMPIKEAFVLVLLGAGLWLIGRTPHRR